MKAKILAVLLGFLSLTVPVSVSADAITRVAGNHAEAQANALSVSVTLPSVTAPNNFIGCYVGFANTSSTVTVADNVNTGGYSIAIGPVRNPVSARSSYIFYHPSIVAGSTVVTATLSPASATWLRLGCQEYSGAAASAPLDQTASATGTGMAADSGASPALAQTGELAFSGVETQAPDAFTAGAGYSKIGDIVGGNARSSYEDQVLASAAGVDGTFTISPSDNWTEILATFKPQPNPSVTTTSLPGGAVGAAYSQTLAATGGFLPYSWSLLSGSLPSGLTLSNTGVVSGTPNAVGTYSFTVKVTDSENVSANSGSLSIVIVYGSRTDLNTAQFPATIPQVGPNACSASSYSTCGNLTGMNFIVYDDLNGTNRIVRVTDANLLASAPHITYIISSSGDENHFNADSSKLSISTVGTGGAGCCVFNFDKSTMQVTLLDSANNPPYWDYANPNLAYSWSTLSQGKKIYKLDYTNGAPPASTTLVDFATTCMSGTSITSALGAGGLSKDNTTFLSYGGANQGAAGDVYLAVWVLGQGCRLLNTSTGQVTGDWGPTGTATITYSCSPGPTCTVPMNQNEFNLHNARIALGGGWIVIIGQSNTCLSGTCPAGFGPLFWDIGTLNITAANPSDTGGHWTAGFNNFFNTGNPPGALRTRLHTSTALGTRLNTAAQIPTGLAGFDDHINANNFPAGSDSLGIVSSDSTKTANGVGIPTNNGYNGPFVSAWPGEVLGHAVDGSGTTWRFTHDFSTGGPGRFGIQVDIGSGSPDGRYYALGSDWGGTLGAENGAGRCIASAPISAISRTSNVVSVTTVNSQSVVANDQINIASVSDSTYNGNFAVASVIDSTHFTYSQTGANGSSSGGMATGAQLSTLCRGDVFIVELK